MKTQNSADRLNAIAKEIGGVKHYLEIGVAKGDTFFNVEATEKHAVDPRFRFNPKIRKNFSNEIFHSITSNEFFNKALKEKKLFDLIFIDGLHTFNQTLRDFLTSQAVAHSKTIWLIDDTIPTSAIAAEADLEKVKLARKILSNDNDQTWMGDVFKVPIFINAFLPQYTCLTTEGHGQTIVIKKPNQESNMNNYLLEEINKLSFVDMMILTNSVLKPKEFSKILKIIAKSN